MEAASEIVAADAGVVAGGEAIGADLAGHAEKRLEFYVGVAFGAGDGSAAVEVVVHERTDDVLLELMFEVDNVMWKIQVSRNAFGASDIVEEPTVLRRAVALEFGRRRWFQVAW